MPTTNFDTCIVGQGIAGTTLAWALRWAGQRVAVVDRLDEHSASRVAAGLITPITGQRLVKSPHFDDHYTTANAFYRKVEQETVRDVFRELPMVRLFADQNERELFQQKCARDFGNSLRTDTPAVDDAAFDATHGGFEMNGGRLDVATYLDSSRHVFSDEQCLFEAHVDPVADLQLANGSVRVPKLGIRCGRIVFCQGFAGACNPWFRGVPFDAAKGEILTVRVAGLNERRVFHRGIWMTQMSDEFYRIGATYDRDHLNDTPTLAGREELCSRLREFLKRPFEVVGHHAAVRPIIQGRTPLLGFHPEYPQLGYFNGLASKGALQAPWLAKHFADVIGGKTEPPSELDVSRRVEFR